MASLDGACAASVLKIGIIGVGMVGGPLSSLWAAAGHQVMISSRHPETLTPPPGATKGTVAEVCNFGDIVLLAIPFGATASLPENCKQSLIGKVVVDANNAFPHRDGQAAVEAHASGDGSGTWTANQLPGARIVKAFNTFPFFAVQVVPGKPGQAAVPIAADDEEALEIATQLVRDAGLDPVVVGSLADSARFDAGQPAGPNSRLTEPQLRTVLGLDSQSTGP